MLEQIVVIVKPHAVHSLLKITEILEDAGFRLIGQRSVEVGFDEAWYLCKDERKIPSNSAIVEKKMQSLLGTAVILHLSHQFAFQVIQDLLVPVDNVNAQKAHPIIHFESFAKPDMYDAIAVSASPAIAEKEIQHFFPRFSDMLNGPTSDISKERSDMDTYFRKQMLPTLLDALYDICLHKPAEPVRYLSHFLINENPNHPKILSPGEYLSKPDGQQRHVGLETQRYDCKS